MRNVLSYQSSEYDCAPTSLTNALRYLFDRSDIPPELLRAIYLYTLDTYNERGEYGKCGTSGMAMCFLANWLSEYGRCKGFPISASYLTGDQALMTPNSALVSCLQQQGVAVIRCWLGGDPHYVLLTRGLGDSTGLFDPYAIERDIFLEEGLAAEGIRYVEDQPRVMNRIVPNARLNAPGRGNYAMGDRDCREAMLLFNRCSRRDAEHTIEYMI